MLARAACLAVQHYARALSPLVSSRHRLLRSLSQVCWPVKSRDCVLLGAAILLGGTGNRKMADHSQLTSVADDHYNSQQYEQVVQTLTPVQESDDVEVLWRLARVHYELHKSLDTDAARLQSLQQYYDSLVTRAMNMAPSHANCHKWKAIYLNAISSLQGSRAQVERSAEIKQHMERACELAPDDPTNWHLLGMWAFTVADISWTMRQLARVIYGQPPTASFDEALSHFLRAEQAKPGSYSMNYLMIGKCYQKLSDKENAIKYYKLARDYDLKTLDDKKAHAEAVELLKKLGVK